MYACLQITVGRDTSSIIPRHLCEWEIVVISKRVVDIANCLFHKLLLLVLLLGDESHHAALS